MPDITKELEAHLKNHGITGVKARTAAKSVNEAITARAFSAAEGIVFASYANDSKTPTISHELAHVLQQKPSKPSKSADAVSMQTKRDPNAPVKVEWTYNSGDTKKIEWTYSENPTSSEVRKAVNSLHAGSQPTGI